VFKALIDVAPQQIQNAEISWQRAIDRGILKE